MYDGGNCFPCDCCGACCKLVGNVVNALPTKEGTMECAWLSDGNKCVIYPVRPEVCRVVKDFTANAKACVELRKMSI